MAIASTRAANNIVGEFEFDPSWRSYKSNEYNEYRKIFDEYAKGKPIDYGIIRTPINLEVESTYHCNLQCPYCPRMVDPKSKIHKHINTNVWETLVSQIRGSDTKALMMDHEGEALLNPKLVSMIEEARSAGIIDIWLHTNANLLSERRSKELIEAGVDKLNISIDATTEETYKKVRPGGSLKLVENNVRGFLELKRKMNRNDIRVRVSFLCHDLNQHERKAFIERWKDHVNMVAIQSMLTMSCFESPREFLRQRTTNEKDQRQLSRFTCDNLWTVPVIDTDGNLTACGMPLRPSTSSELIIGNILEQTLEDLWHSHKLTQLRRNHINHDLRNNPTCQACALSCGESAEVQDKLG